MANHLRIARSLICSPQTATPPERVANDRKTPTAGSDSLSSRVTMKVATQTLRPLAILALTGAALTSHAISQGVQFKEPVRISAGDKMLGMGRMYPSPAAHDLNGDGRFDIVIGDLRGHLTFSLQNADGTFANEQKLKDASGKILDFGNW